MRCSIFLLVAALSVAGLGCGPKERDALKEEQPKAPPAAGTSAAPQLPLKSPAELIKEQPVYKVPVGTVIKVKLDATLSTRTASTGAEFTGKLTEPLKSEGVDIASAGADVVGRIVAASDGTGLRRKVELEVRAARIKPAKGDFVEIRTLSVFQPGGETGQPAVLSAGTVLTFQLSAEARFPK